MKTILHSHQTLARFCCLLLVSFSLFRPSPAVGQFGGEGYEELRAGVDAGFPAATATGDQLELTPNTAYADSPGTMQFVYDAARKGEKVRTHDGFRSLIGDFVQDGSAAVWGVQFQNDGEIEVTPQMTVAREQEGKALMVELVRVSPENVRTEVGAAELKSDSNTSGRQPTVRLKIPEPGFYEVRLRAPSVPDVSQFVSSYANFQPQHKGSGNLVTSFASTRSGRAKLTVSYSIYHTGPGRISMRVNGSPAGSLEVKGTGGMDKIEEVEVSIPCEAGENRFEFLAEDDAQLPVTLHRLVFDAQGTRTERQAADCEHNIGTGNVMLGEYRVGEVQGMEISGKAVAGAQVMTIRSPRSGAVHCQFASSKRPEDVILAVVEIRIATADQPGQYFPVTTPFGYFGSTWHNLPGRFGGANFSLWSEDAAARSADIPRLSRLLAYRGDATYTVFGHEGIGVKPIGQNPWSVMGPTERQILAVRKEPGVPLDTFTCYFANLQTGKWELFGSGQKLNESGQLSGLSVGHFMEVLYPSPQRHRESHFRGWYMTKKGQWFQMDQMVGRGYTGAKDMSHRTYGVTEDGWFRMSTGGWFPNDVKAETHILPRKFESSAAQRPAYLQGEHLEALLALPILIEPAAALNIKPDSVEVPFHLSMATPEATGVLYFGTEDKATFPDDLNDRGYDFVSAWKWSQHQDLGTLKPGPQTVRLTGLQPGTRYYYRILVRNGEYQAWSPQTESFTTAPAPR
jgi:hypothetical protein